MKSLQESKKSLKYIELSPAGKLFIKLLFVGSSARLGNMNVPLWLYYALKRSVVDRPFLAEVDITEQCNLRCPHCYHFAGKEVAQENEPSIDEWKKRFGELYDRGVRGVMLMGGEPLLRPEVVLLADRIFPFVEMITNGTQPLPEKESYRHRIFVSLDGTEATHDAIRGAGIFQQVVTRVTGDRRVVFNMTLMEHNYRELEYVVNLADDIGISGVVCNLYTTLQDRGGSISRELRKKMTDELRRVRRLKPGILQITEAGIDWFEQGDHRDACYWREQVLHFDINWKPRYCFADADCAHCGCFSGAMGKPFRSFKHFMGLVGIALRKR
ncbi:MAG TPA: radical SAM protein [bacterium]|nr:radical SAM protein [bacterium]